MIWIHGKLLKNTSGENYFLNLKELGYRSREESESIRYRNPIGFMHQQKQGAIQSANIWLPSAIAASEVLAWDGIESGWPRLSTASSSNHRCVPFDFSNHSIYCTNCGLRIPTLSWKSSNCRLPSPIIHIS
ncbi:MAG: hypothetical protein K1X42_11415 [Opitutaceae bacterium]|nr:hypothetical protein [Opitutaceae bacterium]